MLGLVFVLATPVLVYAQPEPNETTQAAAVESWICPMECDGLTFDEAGDCPVCGMHLVPHEKPGFFDPAALDDAKTFEKPKTALMPGLDSTYFYVGSVALLLLSLLLFVLFGEPRRNMKKTSERWEYPRWEISRGWFGRFVKSKAFQPVLQVPVVLLFALVISAGLFGNQDPSRNIAPVLTWNIWWMGLIFFAFIAGEIWCTVCPWMAVPDWLSRAGAKLSGKVRPLGLHRPWPKALKSLWPAIVMFLGVTWLELVYEAPYRPALTAMMGLGMVLFAGLTLFVFDRKGFCRYVCPVGRVTGAYGTTGMLEIRRKDTAVCHSCKTKDCFHGNENGLPCPTWEFMGAMNENMSCTMCTECLKTCPHDNIGLNIRAPLADLMGPHRKRADEAWLLLMILIITIFHGLAMIPLWTHDIVPPFREAAAATGWDPGYMTAFTVAMAAFVAGFVGLYYLVCIAVKFASGNVMYKVKDYFIAFSYVLLPVALTYHLAHNSLHFFYEGSKLVRLASDPFGWGWNLFGTAESPLTMLVPMPVLWGAQILLVLCGQLGSLWLARRTAHRMFGNKHQRIRALVVWVISIALLSLAALWLLNQPMEMRTA